MKELYIAPDGKARCHWCGTAQEFLDYHDKEWGYPVDDDRHLFEKLCLESFQASLSWRTILVRHENFRIAFQHLNLNKVALFTISDVERLIQIKE
jgi:DNA-3-methyladenine glycosylase I